MRVVVAFEADQIDPDPHRGWRVIATGYASPVDDPAEVSRFAWVPGRGWMSRCGGIYNGGGTMTLTDSTITGNGAAAINIARLDAYFTHQRLDRTHASRLMRLQAATTN